MKRYDSEKKIVELVRLFETGAIARADWRHAEHLTVAFYYASRHDFETALRKMRAGIFNLLKAFKVNLSKEMPYHETLTVFWMRTVFDFYRSQNACFNVETCNELIEKFDKDYPLHFYSRELLFSEKARAATVEPDLREISSNE